MDGYFDTFTPVTVAGGIEVKKEVVYGSTVTLYCWDTAGSERYASLTRMYLRNARAAVICFDLTRLDSFKKARSWVSEILAAEGEKCRLYLCGNKKDLVDNGFGQRAVEKEEAETLADELQADYFETSSKTGENIDALFNKIAADFVAKPLSDFHSDYGFEESIKIESSPRQDAKMQSFYKVKCCTG